MRPSVSSLKLERKGSPTELVRVLAIVAGLFASALLARQVLEPVFADPAFRTWSTIFVSIVVQALPFLAFGVCLSAAIAAFVPASFFTRVFPSRPAAAVPVAGIAGAVLPGCECASVPVANGLMQRGVAPAAAFAFLLSAPAINPVVMIATALAFPGRPDMVVARFVASLATAVIVGWLWARFGRTDWIKQRAHDHLDDLRPWPKFFSAARHDFLHAGGFLVIGGLAAATLNVVVPRGWLDVVADNPVLSIFALAALAVVLCICSEADAFVAASLSQFSLTSRLVFLVVGPMVDIKLIALQVGTFGRSFAMRFAPVTLVVAITVSVLVAGVVL